MSNTKKMTVKEVINKYNTFASDKLKENLLHSVINNTYVPYEKKVTICEKIIESSYYINVKEKDGKETKKMHVNSPVKYMFYCLNIVNNYTNIDVDFKNSLEEFNMLNGSGCLDIIFNSISDKEIKEFRAILDMVESDVMQNEYETHAFIGKQIERFGNLAGVTLVPLFEQLVQSISNIDEKTVDKLIKGLSKVSNFN